MGACISTSNRTSRSRKCSLRSRRRKGKVSAAVSEAPKTLFSNGGNRFAVREFVRVEAAATSRRKSEVSNLTVHLTRLQWHHNHIERNVICQEESWFDSTSILESDSDDDFISTHGDGVPVTSNAIGAQVLEYENASRIVDAMCKYEECGNSTPIALVVEEYFKREEGKSEVLSQDEDKEPDKGLRAQGAGASIERTMVLEEPCDIFKSLNEDGREAAEKSHEDGSKQIKLPNTHHLVPSFSFNDKTPQVPSASAFWCFFVC